MSDLVARLQSLRHTHMGDLSCDFCDAANALDRQAQEIAELRAGLRESVKLQSHYAQLLNEYDGGQRMTFANEQAWLDRLSALLAKYPQE